VLNLPGEIVGPVIEGASHLVLGQSERMRLLVRKVAVDVAAPLGAAKLMRGGGVGSPPIPKVGTDISMTAADIVAKRIEKDRKEGGRQQRRLLNRFGDGSLFVIADVGGPNIQALGAFGASARGITRGST